MLKFSLPPTPTPNDKQVEYRWRWVPNARSHVHFMFFVFISFALGGQRKPSFQWNMGFSRGRLGLKHAWMCVEKWRKWVLFQHQREWNEWGFLIQNGCEICGFTRYGWEFSRYIAWGYVQKCWDWTTINMKISHFDKDKRLIGDMNLA